MALMLLAALMNLYGSGGMIPVLFQVNFLMNPD
jgi:hypothetical protein